MWSWVRQILLLDWRRHNRSIQICHQKEDINSIIKYLTDQSLFLSKNNKAGKSIQEITCIKRLFCCNSPPLAILESIIRRPKNAEPLKAIHKILLNPLNGDWDSFNSFFFNSGSIFDINTLNYKIKSIWKIQYLIRPV